MWLPCVRVRLQFVSLVQSLPEEDQKKELLLGLSEPDAAAGVAGAAGAADSGQVVARRVSLMPTTHGRPVVVVATHEVIIPQHHPRQAVFHSHAGVNLRLVARRHGYLTRFW
jgi:hypothetical protein